MYKNDKKTFVIIMWSGTVCRGGIGLKFEATELGFVDAPAAATVGECEGGLDGPRDLTTRRRFDRLVIGALRQAWRTKRHALQTTDDLRPLVGRMQRLPVNELISRVIDRVEDRQRRIVDVDCDNNSLVCRVTDS